MAESVGPSSAAVAAAGHGIMPSYGMKKSRLPGFPQLMANITLRMLVHSALKGKGATTLYEIVYAVVQARNMAKMRTEPKSVFTCIAREQKRHSKALWKQSGEVVWLTSLGEKSVISFPGHGLALKMPRPPEEARLLAARQQAQDDGADVKEVVLTQGEHGFGFRLDLTNNTVQDVDAGSPSAVGGLQPGDAILAVNNQLLSEHLPLQAVMGEHMRTGRGKVTKQQRNGSSSPGAKTSPAATITFLVRREPLV